MQNQEFLYTRKLLNLVSSVSCFQEGEYFRSNFASFTDMDFEVANQVLSFEF